MIGCIMNTPVWPAAMLCKFEFVSLLDDILASLSYVASGIATAPKLLLTIISMLAALLATSLATSHVLVV